MSLRSAIDRIQAGLNEDPRRERAEGEEGPRDLLFTRRVVDWVRRLTPEPSDALLLAAWGHDLHRWKIPRESQPKTTMGYHKWRRAQAELSAREVETILRAEGVPIDVCEKVRRLILRDDFPKDPDAQVLEDADCLAFLELKLESYLSEWDEVKTLRILKGTLEKMTPSARELASTIRLSDQARHLLAQAQDVPSVDK